MAVIRYSEILFLAVLCVLSLGYLRWSRRRPETSLPTNWPMVGMLPAVLRNSHCIHEYMTEVLKESGGTFMFKGPWFANMEMLITSDTANIHHILSKNFSNFPKGPEFNRFFDILGDGIFNADSELWENQRKTAMSLLNHHEFQKFVEKTSQNKVEKGLIPVLEHASELGTEMDLQELFQRFTFDSTCILVLGHDPASLSIGLPHIACEKAFTDAEEAVFYRHILPDSFWKLQRWLQVGKEKKLSKAWETLDLFIAQCISSKREELSRRRKSTTQMVENREEDLLTSYMTKACDHNGKIDTSGKFLRDTSLNLVFAGRDTTSSALTWFFWLVATNPSVENKIREEIITKLHPKEEDSLCFSNINKEEMEKLVYLHGALCESLRLFQSVPLQHKTSLQQDILPSGNRSIGANTRMILSFYSMGRMETIWEKDCLEFKPERWITEQGGTKREPSYKFIAFNAGPRSCLGKDMTFIQMKIIATAIIYNYHIQVVDAHPISPSDSVVLQMKDGLKVTVIKIRV